MSQIDAPEVKVRISQSGSNITSKGHQKLEIIYLQGSEIPWEDVMSLISQYYILPINFQLVQFQRTFDSVSIEWHLERNEQEERERVSFHYYSQRKSQKWKWSIKFEFSMKITVQPRTKSVQSKISKKLTFLENLASKVSKIPTYLQDARWHFYLSIFASAWDYCFHFRMHS